MDMYRIENVVCYPLRTATLVDNETIEDQIGEGCREGLAEMEELQDLIHMDVIRGYDGYGRRLVSSS